MRVEQYLGSVCVLNTAKAEILVDAADVPLLPSGTWNIMRTKSGGRYAARWIGSGNMRRKILLHRLIANAPIGDDVDHIDRNGLNNRRANLRVCSRSQNNYNSRRREDNTSGFKGVYLHTKIGAKKWRAVIKVDGKRIYLGLFATPAEAAVARNAAANRFHGEFARSE